MRIEAGGERGDRGLSEGWGSEEWWVDAVVTIRGKGTMFKAGIPIFFNKGLLSPGGHTTTVLGRGTSSTEDDLDILPTRKTPH